MVRISSHMITVFPYSKGVLTLVFVMFTFALRSMFPQEREFALCHEKCAPEDSIMKEGQIYSNPNYGYSIVIPQWANGCKTPAPAPNHGISIVIPNSNAQIWVDGQFNVQGYKTINEALAQYVLSIKSAHPGAKVLSRGMATLGNSKARKVIIKYVSASGVDIQEMGLLTIRRPREADTDDSGIIYTIGVIAPKVEFAKCMQYVDELSHRFVFLWQ